MVVGKTTLARTICGLQREIQGEILYNGEKVPTKQRMKKAYLVMQDPDYQLFTDRVYQELSLALLAQKTPDEQQIINIMEKLNLTEYKDHHPMSLSGDRNKELLSVLRLLEIVMCFFLMNLQAG